MGNGHHSHWFGNWHHAHHAQHWFQPHHWWYHYEQGYVFGSRGDDLLEGTEKGDAIIGRKGNDEFYGNGGKDWLDGGWGNDLLDGGAGNDKVFGGKGDDIAVYSMAENAGNGGRGRGDFYDGGEGNNDVLRLILTADELADANVQADIAAFEAFLVDNPSGCGNNGEVFRFTSFDLAVRNFEALEIPGSSTPPQVNTPPEARADDFTVIEDTPLILDVHTNDSDADGDLLSAVIVDGPAHGRLEVDPQDGSLTYTPDDDYFGPDGFSYRASDGIDVSEPVDVTLDGLPENDAPELKDPDDLLVWQANKGQLIFIDVLDHFAPEPRKRGGPDGHDQVDRHGEPVLWQPLRGQPRQRDRLHGAGRHPTRRARNDHFLDRRQPRRRDQRRAADRHPLGAHRASAGL